MKDSKFIDHTLLHAYATKDQILKLCDEAITNDFASVCVNPYWVNTCYQKLRGTNVSVCTVIGFPLGANSTKTKVFETKQAIFDGADEIDMVINVAEAKMGNYEMIYNEIAQIKEATNNHVLKVILETCYLTEEQIEKCCFAAKRAKADFVKTSTGFGTKGATIDNVLLMVKAASPLEVKASGGIRTKEDFALYKEAGATRIGTSNGLNLIGGENDDTNSAY